MQTQNNKQFLIGNTITEVPGTIDMSQRPIIKSHKKLAKHHVEITQEHIAKRNVTNTKFTKKLNCFVDLAQA